MDPSLQPSADQVEALRQRQMNSMRDFSRMMQARLSRLIQTEYEASHGTAANPIEIDSDSDDDDANANGNDHHHSNSQAANGDGGANLTSRLDDLELHTLPPPRAPLAELDYDGKDAPDEGLWQAPLHDQFQHDPQWPCMVSAVRDEPLPPNIALPVPVRAPPGPTEAHFVWADERDEYLARCPENADFSEIVFMPVPRPAKFDALNATIINDEDDHNNNSDRSRSDSTSSSSRPAIPAAATAPPPPPPSPHQDLLLLTPSEASHMRNLFIAKGQALAERATAAATAAAATAAAANASLLLSPPASSGRLLLRMPHLDDDDDSVRAHYESCEVCRGIRRRAVPDEHEYWARVNELGEGKGKVREMRVGGVVTRSGGRGAAKREGSEE